MNRATLNNNYDIIVVGAGVNGTGIALDAAGRGLKVLLCDKSDIASGTSSKSSKLIHGGLRYLEYFEFSLVREALAEREILLRKAPHIIKPLRFRLPHTGLRPPWVIRLGLWLYDHLVSRQTLAGSKGIRCDASDKLRAGTIKGFEYSDAWVDDARLVVLNAVSAKALGCDVLPRTACVGATRNNNGWQVHLQQENTDQPQTVTAKALVNAAGPWVEQFLTKTLPEEPSKALRLVKGSHIVVPKIHRHDKAYLIQNDDRRVIFVLPYETNFSLVGTTEVKYTGDPATAQIDESEYVYLLAAINTHFSVNLQKSDIVHSFSGVRPLVDDETSNAQAVSREYLLTLRDIDKKAPLLTVYGGKITTYRSLAEAAVDKLQPYFKAMRSRWTANAPLAGGDFDNRESLAAKLSQQYPFLSAHLSARFARSYGTLSYRLLAEAHALSDMGQCFGKELYAREVTYLIEEEFATTSDDILWRRSKLGLYRQAIDTTALSAFISTHLQQH